MYLLETFDMYVGNIYPMEDNLGFKDARLGWDSLSNESMSNVTLTSERIQNLIDIVFLQSRTTKDKVYYNKLEYKLIAVSYPLGQCLRYKIKIYKILRSFQYLFSLKIERNEELAPMVFGLYINQSLLRQNNITDMNIYFYDPINAVRFIPSKVKLKYI